jgi:hypothetical protein
MLPDFIFRFADIGTLSWQTGIDPLPQFDTLNSGIRVGVQSFHFAGPEPRFPTAKSGRKSLRCVLPDARNDAQERERIKSIGAYTPP